MLLRTQVSVLEGMVHMFKKLIDILKAHPRKIVFTEGTDPRILEASARLLSRYVPDPRAHRQGRGRSCRR